MYRDFSAKSKQQLLQLVKEVENSKNNWFTDWVGDQWSRFQSWIGELNIKKYINNVNDYHKKVFDKNNTSAKMINEIFSNVEKVDDNYRKKFIEIKNALQSWETYVNELALIVLPSNGVFSDKFIRSNMPSLLKDAQSYKFYDYKVKTAKDIRKDAATVSKASMKIASKKANGRLSKAKKDVNMTTRELTEMTKRSNVFTGVLDASTSAISFASELDTFMTTDYQSTGEVFCGWVKLDSKAAGVYGSVYKYYDKTLTPLEASRLAKRAGRSADIVSVAGSSLNLTMESIDTYKVFADQNAETYQKVSQSMKEASAISDMTKTCATVSLGKKVLTRDVTAKYVWSTPAKNAAKLDKYTVVTSVASVAFDTVSGGADRYGKVTADGSLDMNDISEVGVAAGFRGLASVASTVTFGLTDVVGLTDKTEQLTDMTLNYVDTNVENFVETHKVASSYRDSKFGQKMIEVGNDEDANIAVRIGASAVGGVGMVGAVAVDAACETVSIVGGWVKSGWNWLVH